MYGSKDHLHHRKFEHDAWYYMQIDGDLACLDENSKVFYYVLPEAAFSSYVLPEEAFGPYGSGRTPYQWVEVPFKESVLFNGLERKNPLGLSLIHI